MLASARPLGAQGGPDAARCSFAHSRDWSRSAYARSGDGRSREWLCFAIRSIGGHSAFLAPAAIASQRRIGILIASVCLSKRQRMAFQPERAGNRCRINAKPFPPGSFIAVTMDLAVMAATKWDCIFVTDLAAQRAALSEAEVVRVTGGSAADQAGLLGNIFDMLAVANPARLRQHQNSLVNASTAPSFRGRAWMCAITSRLASLHFLRTLGLWDFWYIHCRGCDGRQSGLERLLDASGIFCAVNRFFRPRSDAPKARHRQPKKGRRFR
jgi:hypothetical protein